MREANPQGAFQIPLDSVRVASPCRASWDGMQGDDRARFCQTCRKNVYNLSAMSRTEAEALIREKEGNLCARFYQRADGTILTADCPVGVRVIRRPFAWLAAGFAGLLASGMAIAHVESSRPHNTTPPPPGVAMRLRDRQPFKMIMDRISPEPQPMPLMGAIAMPVPPTIPAPQKSTGTPVETQTVIK